MRFIARNDRILFFYLLVFGTQSGRAFCNKIFFLQLVRVQATFLQANHRDARCHVDICRVQPRSLKLRDVGSEIRRTFNGPTKRISRTNIPSNSYKIFHATVKIKATARISEGAVGN